MSWDTEVAGLSGLVGWWKLDEAGATADNAEGTSAKDGTYTGSPSQQQTGLIANKPASGCVLLNGSSQYVTIADHNDFSLTTTGALSIGFWCKPVSTTAGLHYPVAKGVGSGNNWEWGVIRNGTGPTFSAIVWEANGTPRESNINPPAGSLADAGTYFVVVTLDDSGGDAGIMYINGVAGTTATGFSNSSTNGTSPVNIGRRPNGDLYFSGYIQDVFITNTVLTPTQVSDLYTAGLTSPDTDVSAEHAAATGVARQPSVSTSQGATAGVALVDGWASQGEGSDIDVAPDAVTATGSSTDASASVQATAEHVAVTAELQQHGWVTGVPAGDASTIFTGQAHDPTVDIVQGSFADAEHVAVTGEAYDAEATPRETVTVDAEHVSATGEAQATSPAVKAPTSTVSVAGAAYNSQQTYASPEVAEATGASSAPAAKVEPSVGATVVTGTASTSSTSVVVSAGHASATVSAEAVAIAVAMHPEVASAVAEAYPGALSVATRAGLVATTGAAGDVTPSVATRPAAVSVTGAAGTVSLSVTVSAAAASTTGAAYSLESDHPAAIGLLPGRLSGPASPGRLSGTTNPGRLG